MKISKSISSYWWVPVVLMTQEFIGIQRIQGRSMSPTLNPNTDKERDIVLVWKTNQVKQSDICFFEHPFLGISLVKRCSALEGDWMYCKNKHGTVPKGHIWVQAEESYRGQDSRDFGPIPRGLVWGKAIAIIYPLNRMRWF